MDALIRLLSAKKLSKRLVGIFGSYGWSGGAVKGLRKFVEERKLELIEPVVETQFSATAEQLKLCDQLGQNVAEAVLKQS